MTTRFVCAWVVAGKEKVKRIAATITSRTVTEPGAVATGFLARVPDPLAVASGSLPALFTVDLPDLARTLLQWASSAYLRLQPCAGAALFPTAIPNVVVRPDRCAAFRSSLSCC